MPSKHKLHQKFTRDTLGLFPYQFDRIWNKLAFSGIGTAPIIVESPEALFEAVQSTPGAIGYAEQVNSNLALNVVRVEKE